MSGPPLLDVLKELGPNAIITASTPEDPKVRDHRLFMEKVLAIFGMVVVVALFITAVVMVFHSTDAEVRKAGFGLLGAILTGVLGFWAGRGSK